MKKNFRFSPGRVTLKRSDRFTLPDNELVEERSANEDGVEVVKIVSKVRKPIDKRLRASSFSISSSIRNNVNLNDVSGTPYLKQSIEDTLANVHKLDDATAAPIPVVPNNDVKPENSVENE